MQAALLKKKLEGKVTEGAQPTDTQADVLSEQDQKLKERYGGNLPKNGAGLKLAAKQRQYFDSGDYAMQKAGLVKGSLPTNHPSPNTYANLTDQLTSVPHSTIPVSSPSILTAGSTPIPNAPTSPTKERADAAAHEPHAT